MGEFYNCNFKVGDIIIGVDSSSKKSYLRICKIVGFDTHEDLGRTFVDYAKIEFVTEDDLLKSVHRDRISVKFLNHYFRRIVVEEV